MREKIVKVHQFEELSEEAKEKAINELSDINVDHEWYESTYEDAENIGIKITGFELGNRNYCKGEWIENPEVAAEKILKEHGKDCETFSDAINYIKERNEIIAKDIPEEYGDFSTETYNALVELDKEFLKTLLEDYRVMLSKDYDYLTSKEAIVETIKANEYEFLESGELA